jgi:hypothetical protein
MRSPQFGQKVVSVAAIVAWLVSLAADGRAGGMRRLGAAVTIGLVAAIALAAGLGRIASRRA